MTTVHATIDPAGRSLSDRASLSGQASSPGQGSAGKPVGRPHVKAGDPLSPKQAEALAALRRCGTQAKAAREIGLTINNFSPLMAMAGALTVLEADQVVEVGAIDPDDVHLPGIFVKRIVHVPEHANVIEFRTVREAR